MNGLEKCPFCGEQAELQKPFNSNYKFVSCQSCMAQGPKSVNEQYAVEWWNKRPLNKVVEDGQACDCTEFEHCCEAGDISCNYRCGNYTPAT